MNEAAGGLHGIHVPHVSTKLEEQGLEIIHRLIVRSCERAEGSKDNETNGENDQFIVVNFSMKNCVGIDENRKRLAVLSFR